MFLSFPTEHKLVVVFEEVLNIILRWSLNEEIVKQGMTRYDSGLSHTSAKKLPCLTNERLTSDIFFLPRCLSYPTQLGPKWTRMWNYVCPKSFHGASLGMFNF